MRIKPPECRTLRTAASNLRSLRDVAPKEHQQDEEGNGQAGPLGILRVQNPPSLVPLLIAERESEESGQEQDRNVNDIDMDRDEYHGTER